MKITEAFLDDWIPERDRTPGTDDALIDCDVEAHIQDNFTVIVVYGDTGKVTIGVTKRRPDDAPDIKRAIGIGLVRAYRRTGGYKWKP